jgi:hypothetical protein
MRYWDTNGQWLETAWDVASLVMGVQFFVSNVREGNVGSAGMESGL